MSHKQLLPVNIVIEWVIAAESYKRPQPQSIGKKDLRSGIEPYLTEEQECLAALGQVLLTWA